jgi:hypothetical protein
VNIGSRYSFFGGRGDEERTTKSGNPVAEFKENLILNMQHLDKHLVAYVWASMSSMTSDDVTLIGRSLAPLQDFTIQRKATTWGVFDIIEGHRVAELKVKYSVCTTPSAVRRPHLIDAKQTQVTVKWEPPESDHGAPTEAYRISILYAQDGREEAQWWPICERSKTTNPVYVVTNLTGNKSYMMDIRAINKVGVGDPCEFQITTAPVEPGPPARPVIAEAREGCLNVVWQGSSSDGGAPITVYKVRMRKVIGASRWNPFGPGESSATWVDMGTVGASLPGECASYDAWVGPLEEQTCEYKFRIVAVNQVGESKGSELSEAYYV